MASCWFIGSAFLTGIAISGTGEDTAGTSGAESLSCDSFDAADGADAETAAPLTSRCQSVSSENRWCAVVNSSWVVCPPQVSKTVLRSKWMEGVPCTVRPCGIHPQAVLARLP